MIFTIGYEAMSSPLELQRIASALNALLIDVRSMPRSRKPGFSKSGLAALLGPHYYATMGDQLGGRTPVTDFGIAEVTRLSATRDVILMCMEEAPGHCHRHSAICGPHFPRAVHIYQDELLKAESLSVAIATEGYYDVLGSLAELVKNPKKARKLLAWQ